MSPTGDDTGGPTTAAPTTATPTTAAPTEPTALAPTTPEARTTAPTTAAPSAAGPATAAPTTPEPTDSEPTTAARDGSTTEGGSWVEEIDTDLGPTRVHPWSPPGLAFDQDADLLLLGHGAGGGVEAADLQALTHVTEHGWRLGLVEQPWRVAGRRIAPPPARLDQAWTQIVPALLSHVPTRRLVVGGRSAGARVACRTASGELTGHRADGVLCLAFPLHPPGKPEKSRADELLTPLHLGIPTLVVQGSRDPFGSPEEVRAAVPESDSPLELREVPGTHSPTRDLVALASHVGSWLDGLT